MPRSKKRKLRPFCGAKTRSGAPCKNRGMSNGRCRMHGGKSLAGIASPTFKHGKYSAYMPERLQERYAKSLHDPDILSSNDELALLDSRLIEKLERLRDEVGDGSRLWTLLQSAYDDLRAAAASGNASEVGKAIMLIGEIIKRGYEEHLAWSDILVLTEQRRKLKETEQKRRLALQLTLDIEEAMAMNAAVAHILEKYIGSDRKLLSEAVNELRDILLKNQGAPIRTKKEALQAIARS